MYDQYDLELEKAVEEIKKINAKKVGLQLPDGLKPNAGKIAKELNTKTGAEIIIWAGDAYGACDIAFELRLLKIDLLIHWGHTEWKYYPHMV